MTIVAMDHIWPFSQKHHDIKRSLLQEHVHGEIVKMPPAPVLPKHFLFILFGVGIDTALAGITVCLDQEQPHAVEFSLPDGDRFTTLLAAVVHIHFKKMRISAGTDTAASGANFCEMKAQLGCIYKAVPGQNHADCALTVAD